MRKRLLPWYKGERRERYYIGVKTPKKLFRLFKHHFFGNKYWATCCPFQHFCCPFCGFSQPFWRFWSQICVLAFRLYEINPIWKSPNPILQYERTTKLFYSWAYSPFAFEEEFPNLYFFSFFRARSMRRIAECKIVKNY